MLRKYSSGTSGGHRLAGLKPLKHKRGNGSVFYGWVSAQFKKPWAGWLGGLTKPHKNVDILLRNLSLV